MSRREFPAKVKAQAFDRAAGKCEGCGTRLCVGKFHYDHDLPDWLGGEPTLDNCRVLCLGCHGEKTAGRDVPIIAHSKRVKLRHIGAKAPSRKPMPGSRASGIRKRMNGRVEKWS